MGGMNELDLWGEFSTRCSKQWNQIHCTQYEIFSRVHFSVYSTRQGLKKPFESQISWKKTANQHENDIFGGINLNNNVQSWVVVEALKRA